MSVTGMVHVIDDDEAVRESLAFLLRSARIDVQTHESATAFIANLPKASPGCIITDVRMPGISGVELLNRLHEVGVTAPVIVVTGHGDVQLAVEAMKGGAIDFFEKPFDDDVLLACVRSALERRKEDDQQSAHIKTIGERVALLSNRERDVLEGLVAGKPNKIIAFDLGISPRTVEIYRANVMTKMQAGSLSELVRMALVVGMLKSTPRS